MFLRELRTAFDLVSGSKRFIIMRVVSRLTRGDSLRYVRLHANSVHITKCLRMCSLSLSLSLSFEITCASKKRDMRSGGRSCDCDSTRATSRSVSLGGVAPDTCESVSAERNRVGYTLSPDIRLNISLRPSNLWSPSQARSNY